MSRSPALSRPSKMSESNCSTTASRRRPCPTVRPFPRDVRVVDSPMGISARLLSRFGRLPPSGRCVGGKRCGEVILAGGALSIMPWRLSIILGPISRENDGCPSIRRHFFHPRQRISVLLLGGGNPAGRRVPLTARACACGTKSRLQGPHPIKRRQTRHPFTKTSHCE